MPEANAAVPFSFWRRAKKRAVFWMPMMRVKPQRKRIWRGDERASVPRGLSSFFQVAANREGSENGKGLFAIGVHCPLLACGIEAVSLFLLAGAGAFLRVA